MNYIHIDKASISNGLGFRVVLWCAGCTLKCKGCQNPQAQDFNAGKPFDENAKKIIFEQLSKPYIKGITFSGGHPLELENIDDIHRLLVEIKDKFPNKDIWLYTGYTLDIFNFTTLYKGISPECIRHNTIHTVLNMCDVVVDGPYIEDQRDITLKFRGSRNQQIWKKSEDRLWSIDTTM